MAMLVLRLVIIRIKSGNVRARPYISKSNQFNKLKIYLKMKIVQLLIVVFVLQISQTSFGQTSNPVISLFPKGTILHGNIAYNNDTLSKHLLDIYIPPNVKSPIPLIVFIHGGAWISNDKYADIGYMKNTVGLYLQQKVKN